MCKVKVIMRFEFSQFVFVHLISFDLLKLFEQTWYISASVPDGNVLEKVGVSSCDLIY